MKESHSPYRRTLLNPFGFGGVKSTLLNPFGIALAPGTFMWGILGVVIFCIVLQLPNARIKRVREGVFFWPLFTFSFLCLIFGLSAIAYSFVYNWVESDSRTWVMILINLLIDAWFVLVFMTPFIS